MKEIRDIIRLFERHCGEPLALATLVRTHGSSYRRPGARMLICADGSTAGSLSGGCLEEEVARRAQEVMRDGRLLLMNFDTRLRFGCNGSIDVFVERIREELLAELSANFAERRSCKAAFPVAMLNWARDRPARRTNFGRCVCSEMEPAIRP